MLSYSFYETDARVSRYAETLVRRGDQVDVIALGQNGQDESAQINGVNLFRIQKRERNEKGKLSFLIRLLKFFVRSSVFLNRQHRRAPYDVIHVHSVPDFEVFAAWFPKLTGTKIILDIHDIVPEFYVAKFGQENAQFLYKLLILIERLSVGFADRVIISNHIWEKTLRRSVRNGKCRVVLNYPDPEVFHERPRMRHDERFVMIYPGTLNWHQGLDVAISAFARVKDDIPHADFHVYGKGDLRQQLESMVQQLGLQNRVFLNDMKPKEQIAEIMANADLGVVPKRNDSFGGEAFSTKTLEFMLLGVPLIVSGTKIDRYYFDDSVVRFFEPEDEIGLASAMTEMVRDCESRQAMATRARNLVAREFDWEEKKRVYLDMVDELSRSHG
jgi:glycosyltransferase involved in cell wall biosynthesis